MRFYTYGAPGTRTDDLRTEDVIRDYKECGFNVFPLFGLNHYDGEGWENSNAKKCFTLCKKIGIKELFLDDWRIYKLSMYGDKLIGDDSDCKFKSTDELDDYVRECMKEYIHEDNLLGFRLHDEPFCDLLKSYAQTYHSVKRVAKEFGRENVYIQINLNPMITNIYERLCPERNKEIDVAYEEYIDAFLKETGADRLCVDNYPFRTDIHGGRFLDGYYRCFQILQKKCKQYNAEFGFVLQSFEMVHKRIPSATAGYRRLTTLNQMMLQMNSALGFGVREISFYTYLTMYSDNESAWRAEDGSSFLGYNNDKTHIYEFGKIAIAYAKALNKTLVNYQFNGAKILVSEGAKDYSKYYLGCGEYKKADGSLGHAEFDNSFKPSVIKNASISKDILLVCEHQNSDGNIIYMFENVSDHIFQKDLKSMSFSVEFAKEIKKAKIFDGEKFNDIELNDACYQTELAVGEATWIMLIKD